MHMITVPCTIDTPDIAEGIGKLPYILHDFASLYHTCQLIHNWVVSPYSGVMTPNPSDPPAGTCNATHLGCMTHILTLFRPQAPQ